MKPLMSLPTTTSLGCTCTVCYNSDVYPEDIPDVFAAVRSTICCDRNIVPPPAATATFVPPSGVSPTITILRKVDVNDDTELNGLTAVFTTMFIEGDIDFERGEITNLRVPRWLDPFLDV